MPPSNITAWLTSLFNGVPDVKTVQKIQEGTFFAPKKAVTDTTIAYYLYCQPIFIILLVIWLIMSIRLIRTENYITKFALMIAYTSLDITALVVQNIAMIAVYSTKDYYIKYELCYVYEAAAVFFPNAMRTISQWLKVGQALTVFLMFYKTLTFKVIVNARASALFVTMSVFISCTISATYYFLHVRFVKAMTVDKTTKEVKEICRYPHIFEDIEKRYRDAEFIITIINDLVQHIIPGILMICLFLGIRRLVKKQIKIRKRLQRESTEREISDIRLAKVTMATTIISFIFIIPGIPSTILVYTDLFYVESVHTFLDVLASVTRLLLVLSIPINFLLFSWLSGQFRNRVLVILKRLYSCI
ncbi:Hypothetical predicted protein [Mytilus galloprovincialis]|uniref:G-protein coupled receptors family 1 profile domain-containing protein n=1 Tax=Mytilus galloprovincialis TaxID=29158 RepID=A0A8B6HIE3_MYTGA|nr:Hypothetical predicted protein [Mytilus galloprovincialis]